MRNISYKTLVNNQLHPMKFEIALNLYQEIVAQIPDMEIKGKTTPYISLNGYMCSFFAKNGDVGIRLSTEDQSEIMSKYNLKLMEQHGRIMKDFICFPSEMLSQKDLIVEYIQKGLLYVKTLKPKPTKKGK